MSIKTRWLTILLAAVLLLGIGLATAAAAPPPQQPYVWPRTILSQGNNKEILPDVAYNHKHNEYLVVWHTTGTPGARTIRGARVSGSGKLLQSFQINGHATKDSAQPAVAYDPVHDRYLVVFVFDSAGNGSNWDLLGRFIPWDGPTPGLSTFLIIDWSTQQWVPDVAYGRAVEEFLVVWANENQGGGIPMYISGKRVRAVDGSFPSGAGADTTISHLSQQRVNPAVTYNLSRNEYLIVYDNGFDIMGKRLTGLLNHDFGGEFGIAGWPDAETRPDVAACHAADQYLVVWQSFQGGTNNAIYGRFVSGDGAVGSVHLIDDNTGAEVEAAVACGNAGTQYLVANQKEYTNHKYGIWARFMQPDGQMSPKIPVQHASNTAARTMPAVAGGKANFLAVWEHERDGTIFVDIYGTLISPYAIFTPMIHG